MKFIQLHENICCRDVIKSVFELNKLDLDVYKKLKEIKESRADILAKKMSKERSTIYRSLQRLTSCNLCTKKIKTIEKGGYYHTYSCNDPKQMKKEIESCIDQWYKLMKDTLKDFEKEMG